MKPNDGSPGVESTLEFVTSPDDVSMRTPSVKVPANVHAQSESGAIQVAGLMPSVF